MATFNPKDVIVTVGGIQIAGFGDDGEVTFLGQDEGRPTMCEWCQAHPRRHGGDERCWRCGHVHGTEMTEGTARPGEPAPTGFTLVARAMCFDGIIPFTGRRRYHLHTGRIE